MIRIAQVTDWRSIAQLLRIFRNDVLTPPWFSGESEHPQAERFLVQMLAQEHSFIALENNEVVGMLLSIRSHVPFTNNPIVEEMAWYVREDHRNSIIAYQLLKSWEAMIDDLKSRDLIVGGILHTMANTSLDMTQHGYFLSDMTYMR